MFALAVNKTATPLLTQSICLSIESYLALLLEQDGLMERDVVRTLHIYADPTQSSSGDTLHTKQAPEHRRHFDVHAFMKAHAPEGAEHNMMPIAAATLWLATYKR